jgi:AcrR family transcriptional regulator
VTAQNTSADLILAAAKRAIDAKGPGKLTLSEVAAAAGVSRPTLYRWFPTKDHLFTALTQYERAQFDEGLRDVINAHRTPARRLDAALRYLLAYLDESMGADPIGVDPEFALRSLNESLSDQVATMFLRVAYSHYLVPHADTQELLVFMRLFAGLPRRALARAVG